MLNDIALAKLVQKIIVTNSIRFLPWTCRLLLETAVKYLSHFKFLRVKNPSMWLSSFIQSWSVSPSSKFCSIKSGSLWTVNTLRFELFLIKIWVSSLSSTTKSSFDVHKFALFINTLSFVSHFHSCEEPEEEHLMV